MTKDKIDELIIKAKDQANGIFEEDSIPDKELINELALALQSQRTELKKAIRTINAVSLELGVKQDNHPVPVANAIDLLNRFLSKIDKGEWLL